MKQLDKPTGIILCTPFISINKELEKQYIQLSEHEKINGNLRTEIDINTAYHYLKNLAFRTEATILKQEQKEMDTTLAENTLKRLLFIQYQFSKLDVDIQTLKRENQLLEEKLNYFKQNFK
jgi:hypothetical protein